MNNKKIGWILIGISLFFIISIIVFKIQIENLVDTLMIESGGSCIKDGICLHKQSDIPVYLGVAVVFVTLALGFYLLSFEKTQETLLQTQKEIVQTLEKSKKKQDRDEKFEFLLKALNEDEQKIMRALKEQEGIEQATLRIRTDLSKTKLSVLLSELEKKSLIKKVPQGKKNRVYLKQKI